MPDYNAGVEGKIRDSPVRPGLFFPIGAIEAISGITYCSY